MKFIEMSGATLKSLLSEDEMKPEQLASAGVSDESIVRVNEQGDIEVRRPDNWDVIGGLLGDFAERIRRGTGFEWA
jgi:hypothetical protein